MSDWVWDTARCSADILTNMKLASKIVQIWKDGRLDYWVLHGHSLETVKGWGRLTKRRSKRDQQRPRDALPAPMTITQARRPELNDTVEETKVAPPRR